MTRRIPQHRTKHADKEPNTGDARARILDAAEKLFAAHGFDGTPTSHIARDAGVPKGLLFYYFPVKFALLAALLDERFSTIEFHIEDLAVPRDPAQSLLNVAARYAAAQSQSEVLRIIVWREEHTRPEVAAALSGHRESLETDIGHVLQASVDIPLEPQRLGAAAHLWSALLTAAPADAKDIAAMDRLRAAAGLVCTGLLAEAPTPST